MNDPASAYQKMRSETAKMLGLDPSASSLIQGLQIDLIALLRLSVDTLQGQVLAGEDVDLDRLADSLSMLRQLLPPELLQAQPQLVEEEPSEREASEALRELTRLLDGYSDQRRREMAADPQAARESFEVELQAAIAEFSTPQLTSNADAPPAAEAAPAIESARQSLQLPSAVNAAAAAAPIVREAKLKPAPVAAAAVQPSATSLFYEFYGNGGHDRWRPDW
jgi:DNA-binding SARP family transcriptional activator